MTALENRTPTDDDARPRAPEEEAGGRWDLDGPTVAILIAGLIPIVGYFVLGEWGPVDLAVGTLFVLFALFQLARNLLRPR